MPIYDYQCKGCGTTFEAVVGLDEQAACPQCDGQEVERKLSAPGHVGVASAGGGLQCGRETTCCGAAEPCAKPGCQK